ncbi:hypothetical protein P7C70_g7410, partial [Phenoliferia sp. Uapishka_3]
MFPLTSAFTLAALALNVASAAPIVAGTGPGHINLKTAGNFTIIGQSGISSVPSSVITGNIACSPIAATGLTGFSLVYGESASEVGVDRSDADSSSTSTESGSTYSTSSQVSEKVYAADYADPTPQNIKQAITDSDNAYNTAQAMTPPDYYNYGAGNIGGASLTPGLYNWNSGVNASSDFTISGSSQDTWVFQIDGVLSLSSQAKASLSGGAQAKNIFWAVTGGAKIGVESHLEGIVSSATTVVIDTNASLHGRAYSQTATTLQKANVTEPANCLSSLFGC